MNNKDIEQQRQYIQVLMKCDDPDPELRMEIVNPQTLLKDVKQIFDSLNTGENRYQDKIADIEGYIYSPKMMEMPIYKFSNNGVLKIRFVSGYQNIFQEQAIAWQQMTLKQSLTTVFDIVRRIKIQQIIASLPFLFLYYFYSKFYGLRQYWFNGIKIIGQKLTSKFN